MRRINVRGSAGGAGGRWLDSNFARMNLSISVLTNAVFFTKGGFTEGTGWKAQCRFAFAGGSMPWATRANVRPRADHAIRRAMRMSAINSEEWGSQGVFNSARVHAGSFASALMPVNRRATPFRFHSSER